MSVPEDRLVGGLHCSEVLERLSDYIDGDLSAEERASVEAHVTGCAVCERFGARFAAMIQTVRARAAKENSEVPVEHLLQKLERALG